LPVIALIEASPFRIACFYQSHFPPFDSFFSHAR
jgi:hypothetical protein